MAEAYQHDGAAVSAFIHEMTKDYGRYEGLNPDYEGQPVAAAISGVIILGESLERTESGLLKPTEKTIAHVVFNKGKWGSVTGYAALYKSGDPPVRYEDPIVGTAAQEYVEECGLEDGLVFYPGKPREYTERKERVQVECQEVGEGDNTYERQMHLYPVAAVWNGADLPPVKLDEVELTNGYFGTLEYIVRHATTSGERYSYNYLARTLPAAIGALGREATQFATEFFKRFPKDR